MYPQLVMAGSLAEAIHDVDVVAVGLQCQTQRTCVVRVAENLMRLPHLAVTYIFERSVRGKLVRFFESCCSHLPVLIGNYELC